MKANRLSTASVMLLLAVAALSMTTTGCDDDDDSCCEDGSDAAGLGGQTYTAATNIAGEDADLVIVTRGGGGTSAAATGGMLASELAAGPADGLMLMETGGYREIMAGVYDPTVVEGPSLTLSSTTGVTFEGSATSTTFSGTLTVPGIDAVEVFGSGGQEDAPLINLLGTWAHDSTTEIDCGTLGTYEVVCSGNTRIHKLGLYLRTDKYETCEAQGYECKLSGPVWTDGTWNGLNYSGTTSSTETFEDCTLEITGTETVTVSSEALSSTTNGDATFTNSQCLPTGTQCTLRQSMSATRCTDCFPSECSGF